MMIVRPITSNDADAFVEIAFKASLGMTSMPKNREILYKRIQKSLTSFAKTVSTPSDEYYLFVLEDSFTGKIVGTSAIISQTARESPLFFFRIEKKEKHEDTEHAIKKIASLRPVQYRNYWSEIASLYIQQDHRKEGTGRLLSLSRFLFMAEHPKRFSKMIFAEMRGHIFNEVSPFWEGIGAHFIDTDFITLMHLFDEGHVDLSKVLPTHPIYIELLPKDVQECIGKVHQNAAPALQMLLQEGFKISSEVDICDGGPKIEAEVQDIRTVRDSAVATIVETTDALPTEPEFLVATRSTNFRTCLTKLKIKEQGSIVIEKKVAENLKINVGDSLRYVVKNTSKQELQVP